MMGDELNTEAPVLEHEPAEPEVQVPPADLRSQLMARFEQWLDQMLADEPPPRGVPDELLAEATAMVSSTAPGNPPAEETDLYTLFSALTTLTGEIRLQGRAFKQLTDLLSPLAETPALVAKLYEAQIESSESLQAMLAAHAEESDSSHVEFKQVCDVMIDLHDRLQRGLVTCEQGIQSLEARRKSGWFKRTFGHADSVEQAVLSVRAIRDAAALTLARLGAALQDWGAARIGRIGEPFDPDRMSAVDIRVDPEVPPGTVLEVNRSGYALNGTLKATAQVTVSKAQ